MNFLAKIASETKDPVQEFEAAVQGLPPELQAEYVTARGATPNVEAFVEKLAAAERMGRELAHEQPELLLKNAAWQSSLAKAVTGKVMPAATKLLQNPRAALAVGGAGVGAVGGALKSPGVDPQTGKPRSRLGNMAMGAGLGAAAGGVAGLNKNIVSATQNQLGKVAPKAMQGMQRMGTKLTGWGNNAAATSPAAAAAANKVPPKFKGEGQVLPAAKPVQPGGSEWGGTMDFSKLAELSPADRIRAVMISRLG